MSERAQTAIDFAIAMGIFLVAVMVVIAFLPEMIEPFSSNPTENPLVADRVANQLIDYQLAGSSPGVLNTTCTLYFFQDSASGPCSSFDGTDSLNGKLGIGESININVTVEQNVTASQGTEVLCGDLSADEVTDPPCGASEHTLALGDEPPSSQVSVSVARRAVYLDGREDVLLFVRIWR